MELIGKESGKGSFLLPLILSVGISTLAGGFIFFTQGRNKGGIGWRRDFWQSSERRYLREID